VMEPLEPPVAPPTSRAKPKGKASAKPAAAAKTASVKTATGKARPIRAKKVDL
jgi:hypothetical protein